MASLDDFRSMGVAVYKRVEDVPFVRDEYWGSFKGSYGTVFRATRRSTRPSIGQEDVYAIKEIQALSAKDQLDVAREIRLLQQFRHENILEFESAFIVDIPGHRMLNTIRLVTKPWAPVSLHHFIQDLANSSGRSTICPWFKPLALNPWPSIVRQCLSGLAYLHNQRPKPIRHKDIKPHNILLSFETQNSERPVRPIIIDFGISKEHIDGATTANTGTYEYKAPEQIKNQNPTLASDIFSLGCCFALIEGVLRPWPGILGVYNAAMDTDTCQFANNTNLVNGILQDHGVVNSLDSPGFGNFCNRFRDLVRQMLEIEPIDRPTAALALDITERLDSELTRRLEIPKLVGVGRNEGPTIPFSRDRDFVYRGDILGQLCRRCSEPAGRVALVGLGGIGKSQLAIEFAYRIAEQEPERWIFWVQAGTQARVEEGFRTIADAVKLPGRNQPKADIPQLVYDWLSNERNGRWVIILDSADDRDVFYAASDGREGKPLVSYLPQSQNGSILITTRDKNLALRLTENIIVVGPMVPDEALLLLEKKLGPVSDVDTARDLVHTLGLVPLAISQAAAYIQARLPRSSVEKYLAEFRKSEQKQAQLLGYDEGGLRRDGGASNAILTTLQISFDHIQSQRPSAAELLSLMSFFDRQGIAPSLLKPVDAECVPQVTRFDALEDSWPESGVSVDEPDDGIEDDVAMLRDFCLVTTNEDGSALMMHKLVQLSMRKWLEADGLQDKFKQQFVERMAAAFPTGDYGNWATCRQLFAHVEAAVDQRPAEDSVEEWATLMHNGGWYAWSQGWYEMAERMVDKARKTRQKRLGSQDEASLQSISLFSLVIKAKGRWKEAESLEVQVMETRKRVLGEEHPNTLTSMDNLASTYRNQGRWKEAESLEEQVTETSLRILGEEHPSTLTSMDNLASTYRNQGRWKEAEFLEVQVMETSKNKLGADHPDTLTSIANLASTYRDQGRWDEAERLFVEVIETRKTKLGADHPDTLTSMANLAYTWMGQGRRDDALTLMTRCFEACERTLGPQHPHTTSSSAAIENWSSVDQ